jgi:hypothetical protein
MKKILANYKAYKIEVTRLDKELENCSINRNYARAREIYEELLGLKSRKFEIIFSDSHDTIKTAILVGLGLLLLASPSFLHLLNPHP